MALRLPQAKDDLGEHRDLLTKIGLIVAGHAPLRDEGDTLYVYRIPPIRAMSVYPDLRKRDYGRLDWDDEGFISVDTDHGRKHVIPVSEPDAALDILNDLLHLVRTRRRELAIESSRRMHKDASGYSSPGGVEGHLLKEYDQLVKQIEHEHYRQRDRRKDSYE